MSEWASTTLSLTPVPLPWNVALERLVAYLAEHHDGDGSVPAEGVRQLVDPIANAIQRNPRMRLRDPIVSPPPGMTVWRGVSIEIYVGAAMRFVTFSFRTLGESLTEVEAWFPTKVYQAIFDFDPDHHGFRDDVKADLLRLYVGVTRALDAEGFGVRLAQEDSVFGAVSTEDLRDYVEIERRRPGHPLRLLMAGLRADLVPEERFEYDLDEEHPVHYRHQGFYVFDLLWPR